MMAGCRGRKVRASPTRPRNRVAGRERAAIAWRDRLDACAHPHPRGAGKPTPRGGWTIRAPIDTAAARTTAELPRQAPLSGSASTRPCRRVRSAIDRVPWYYPGTRRTPRPPCAFGKSLLRGVAPGGVEPPHADSKSAALSAELRGPKAQSSPGDAMPWRAPGSGARPGGPAGARGSVRSRR